MAAVVVPCHYILLFDHSMQLAMQLLPVMMMLFCVLWHFLGFEQLLSLLPVTDVALFVDVLDCCDVVAFATTPLEMLMEVMICGYIALLNFVLCSHLSQVT